METKFNFNSAICTSLEQSRRLLSLGLKKETADMALHFSCVDVDGNAYYIPYTIGHQCTGIPAWSLHRLTEMVIESPQEYYMIWVPNAYDDIISHIESLIKKGHFNKKYLENECIKK